MDSPNKIVEDATPGTVDLAKLKNAMLNAILGKVDGMLTQAVAEPEIQMGILAMAQVLAFRRLLDDKRIIDRGRRMKLISLATRDFESKLRKHALSHEKPLIVS